MKIKGTDLVVGQKYLVEMKDCCVQGHFIGIFQGFTRDEEDDIDRFRFDVGEIGPGWGRFRFEEVG